jgi:hypothetical protein
LNLFSLRLPEQIFWKKGAPARLFNERHAMIDQTENPDVRALTMPERVAKFLKKNHLQAYCDDCISKSLQVNRAQVSVVTSTLALCREYSKGAKPCVMCRQTNKFATHHSEDYRDAQ